MSAINFDAPAILEKTVVSEVAPGEFRATHTEHSVFPSLSACLKQLSQKPASEKHLYFVITNETARIGKCTLGYLDVEMLAMHPNYPLRHN